MFFLLILVIVILLAVAIYVSHKRHSDALGVLRTEVEDVKEAADTEIAAIKTKLGM